MRILFNRKWTQAVIYTEQSCTVSSVDECKRIYGLGIDCDYKILSVEKIDN